VGVMFWGVGGRERWGWGWGGGLKREAGEGGGGKEKQCDVSVWFHRPTGLSSRLMRSNPSAHLIVEV